MHSLSETFDGKAGFAIPSKIYEEYNFVHSWRLTMYTVQNLVDQFGQQLGLNLIAGKKGVTRPIKLPQAHRPGLSLSGYIKHYRNRRLLVLGRVEILYLKDLDRETRQERLPQIFTPQTPAVIIASRQTPPSELIALCDREKIPLFRSATSASLLLSQLISFLTEAFSPTITCHGTLVEAFGIGVLIQGDSSVGKSEAALGLIERGHRLICDDVVKIRVREGTYLEGTGPELSRHLIEIRGIGIINVAHLYGAVCVRDHKSVDLIVKLEEWDDQCFYDRVGLDEKYSDFLGIKVPISTLPVKPGRDVVLLIETLVLNHRLKEMGYNSAQDFNKKLLETLMKKQRGHIGQAHTQSAD